MAEGMSGHPILMYLTFVLPVILLALGVVFEASVFLIILTILWLGVAFGVLYLPLAGDDGVRA
jgi:hypothetical protein